MKRHDPVHRAGGCHRRPIKTDAYHAMFPRSQEGSRRLLETFNRGVAALRAEGELKQLLESALSR